MKENIDYMKDDFNKDVIKMTVGVIVLNIIISVINLHIDDSITYADTIAFSFMFITVMWTCGFFVVGVLHKTPIQKLAIEDFTNGKRDTSLYESCDEYSSMWDRLQIIKEKQRNAEEKQNKCKMAIDKRFGRN